jgi:drug/metabolite transporter (DMT)-like permease
MTNPQDMARSNIRGIAAVLTASALFVCTDSMAKLVLDEMPVGELMFIRNTLASVLCAALAAALGQLAPLSLMAKPRIAVRSAADVSTTLFYLAALAQMPLANVNSIMQSTPLVITAASAMFLREPVGWRRWTATLAGLAGVLLIIRPGTTGYNAGALLCLASIAAVTVRDLATRGIDRRVPSLSLTLYASIAVMLAGLALAPFETWVWPSARAWTMIGASAVLIIAAFYCSITAMRIGELAVVTPFRFSSVVWAMLIGFAVWRDVPNLWTVLGTGIVVAAGVYTFHRERVRREGRAVKRAI